MANNQPDIRIFEGPTRGQAAFLAIQPFLATLADDELQPLNVDMTAAAIGAIGVADRAREPSLLARFQGLPPGEFDATQVDRLSELGWAALHTVTLSSQLGGRGRAKLPADLVERAITLEARMQTCCEYHLGDHPVAGVELARLRPGVGYTDVAADLLGYAGLYYTYQDILSGDTKHYLATDPDDAVSTAEQMYTLLGESATIQAEVSTVDAQRVWTLLLRTYEDVAGTGRWLLRGEARRAERLFPSLFRLSRTGRRTRPEEPDEAPEPVTEPNAEPAGLVLDTHQAARSPRRN
jgi:hypothetical protein